GELRNHLCFRFRVVVRQASLRPHLINAFGYRLSHRCLLDKNSSAAAARAYIDGRRCAFVNQHVHPLGGENRLLEKLLLTLLRGKSRAASSAATAAESTSW